MKRHTLKDQLEERNCHGMDYSCKRHMGFFKYMYICRLCVCVCVCVCIFIAMDGEVQSKQIIITAIETWFLSSHFATAKSCSDPIFEALNEHEHWTHAWQQNITYRRKLTHSYTHISYTQRENIYNLEALFHCKYIRFEKYTTRSNPKVNTKEQSINWDPILLLGLRLHLFWVVFWGTTKWWIARRVFFTFFFLSRSHPHLELVRNVPEIFTVGKFN